MMMITTIYRRKNFNRIQIRQNPYPFRDEIHSSALALHSPLFLEYLVYDLHRR